jgi:hypothetical protein
VEIEINSTIAMLILIEELLDFKFATKKRYTIFL